jgi:S1-C subfamily serine protease
MFNVVRWSALLGLAIFVAAWPHPSISATPKSLQEDLVEIKKELQDLRFDLAALGHLRLADDFDKLKGMSQRLQASAVRIETDAVQSGFYLRGSGFFVTATGSGKTGACEIATDNHVIENTKGATTVYLKDGSHYSAVIELKDVGNDIAVLKISGVKDPATTCPVLPLGTSADVRKPAAVMRVSPDEVMPGVFVDIGDRRDITKVPLDKGEIPDRSITVFDMDSEHGNSGSAIVDVDGKVISLTWAAGKDTTGGTPAEALQQDLDKIHAGK